MKYIKKTNFDIMRKINLLLLFISFAGITMLMNSCKDPCKDVDCQNDGVCIEGDCDCPDGFSGTNCESAASEKTATLQLKFNPTFGDEPINLFEPLIDEDSQPFFELTKLYFYISDLKLDSEAVADEIMLVDIEDPALNVGINKIKPGSYDTVTFGLGVEERWNHEDPTTFENDHPLGFDHSSNHWSWNSGYIFYKVEGNYSIKDDGILDGSFLYHMGTDELYRTISLNKAFNVEEDGTAELTMNVDFRNIFFEEGGLDLKTEFRSHGMGDQFEVGQKFVNRLIESIE